MGTPGDVQPFIDIGRALGARGHRATLIAHANFEPWAKRAGLEFLELGSEKEYRRLLDDKSLWEISKAHRVFAKRLVGPSTARLYRLIEEHHTPLRTIVAAQTFALGARIARDKLPIKLATIHRQPLSIRSVYGSTKSPYMFFPGWLPRPVKRFQFWLLDMVLDHNFAPAVNALRAELGLEEIERLMKGWVHSPDLVLGLWPEWFAGAQRDWPANAKLVGFNLQESQEEAPSAELMRFVEAGEKPVAFTIGSGMSHGRAFYHASVEACRQARRRAVIVTRQRDQLPEEIPSNVHYAPYAPYNWLLPRCAAVVHHAGIGTVAQALAAGIPQLCVPGLVFDTFDSADRLRNLGVSASVLFKNYDPLTANVALGDLLSKPGLQDRCREVAKRIAGSNAIADAASAIEALGSGNGAEVKRNPLAPVVTDS